MSMHCHAYQRYTEASKIGRPLSLRQLVPMVSTLESVTCHHRWSPCKFGGVVACYADNVMNLQLMPTPLSRDYKATEKGPLPLYQLASHFLVTISSIYERAANLV